MSKGRCASADGWFHALVLVTALLVFMVGCSGCRGGGASDVRDAGVAASEPRGRIISADGVVLAESAQGSDGEMERLYSLGEAASFIVGSCYGDGVPDGIEQLYAEDLLAGRDVELTVNADIQKSAMQALGNHVGALVVLNPDDGAVLAMASTPSYDPSGTSSAQSGVDNRALQQHIPGSVFKTVTLATALGTGEFSLDSKFPAPAELLFEDGTIPNYGFAGDGEPTLLEAYARSTNTVFAQLGLEVGVDRIVNTAHEFGFGEVAMADFPAFESDVLGVEQMSPLMQAWTGVGQAVYQPDGSLQGPVMTTVQGAVLAAAAVNGGTAWQPHIVRAIGDQETPCSESPVAFGQPMQPEVAQDVCDGMRQVVLSGTGRSAAVEGVDVGGKTGTAETLDGADDGWFVGFANAGSQSLAFAVMVEGVESAQAAEVAADLVESLYA